MSADIQALLDQIQEEQAKQQAIAPPPAQLSVVQPDPKPPNKYLWGAWGLVAGVVLAYGIDAVKGAIAAPQPKPLKVESLY